MKPVDVCFTSKPVGGNYTAKLCYTCKTSTELMCVKNAIEDYLDTLAGKMAADERQEAKTRDDETLRNKVRETIHYALDQAKELRDSGQHSYAEGLINMAFTCGVIPGDEFAKLMDRWSSLKGLMYKDA